MIPMSFLYILTKKLECNFLTYFAVSQKSTSHAQKLPLSHGKVFAILHDWAVKLTGQRFDFIFHVGTFNRLPNGKIRILFKWI